MSAAVLGCWAAARAAWALLTAFCCWQYLAALGWRAAAKGRLGALDRVLLLGMSRAVLGWRAAASAAWRS